MFFVRIFICLFLFTITAKAEDYYGEFVGNPVGEFMTGLPGTDRPLFELHQKFSYKDPNKLLWTTPKGEVIDGASIPSFAWSIVGGPFSGNYLNAAVIHDYYCCAKNRNYYDTHEAFRRGMLVSGVSSSKAWLMWAAVRYAGPDWWAVDPKFVPPVPCKSLDIALGKGTKTVFKRMNNKRRRIAVSKYVGIARTLRTTGGRVLDIVGERIVLAQAKPANLHMDTLYKAATSNWDFPLQEMGLFSIIDERELEFKVFDPWRPGQIPRLDQYMEEQGLLYPEANFDPVRVENPNTQDLSIIPDRLISEE